MNQATTSLTRSSSGPTVFGEAATFTVNVAITGNGTGTPTGTVTFYADGNLQDPIGSSALSAGTATLSDSTLSVGTHSICMTLCTRLSLIAVSISIERRS